MERMPSVLSMEIVTRPLYSRIEVVGPYNVSSICIWKASTVINIFLQCDNISPNLAWCHGVLLCQFSRTCRQETSSSSSWGHGGWREIIQSFPAIASLWPPLSLLPTVDIQVGYRVEEILSLIHI